MTRLGHDGRRLLMVLNADLKKGRFKPGDPKTFMPYSEALERLGRKAAGMYPGRRLQREGLTELNEWTKTAAVPKIAGLMGNKGSWEPSSGYHESHGLSTTNDEWKSWWLSETTRAIAFNWDPFLVA